MSTSDSIVVDILIVGAGPTGLFGAYYAGFRGLSVAVVDSLPEPGGQINAMYPEKQIFDIAGFPSVRGRELVDRLLQQAEPFDPVYLLGHRADVLGAQVAVLLRLAQVLREELARAVQRAARSLERFLGRPLPRRNVGGD